MRAVEDREAGGPYRFGPFRLDVGERRLLRDGRPIPVSRKAFDLLVELVRAAPRLQSREELVAAVWPDTVVEEANLTWNINALRKLLGDNAGTHVYIETVRGHGYRFIAPVLPAAAARGTRGAVADGAPPAAARGRFPARTAALTLVAALAGAVAVGVLVSRHVAGSGGAAAIGSSGASTRSIAVLPFENMSGDRSNAYFVSGIHDMILTKLAGIGDLKVIARASTAGYSSRPRNLGKVARELGVANLLEGSVQRVGDQVLVNVQLVDARTGNHIWAHAYTRTLSDIFAVESDVAEQVAAALNAKLGPEEAARVARTPTSDPLAYDLFLRAEYLAMRVEDGEADDPAATVAQAVDLYRRATARDPRFALADARLSYLQSYAYWFNLDRTPGTIAAAERAAKAALALEPDLPQAHLAMGFVYYWKDGDYAAALAEFERALRALPNSADAVGAVAYVQRREGHWNAAVAGLERAAALDPRNSRWPYSLGNTLTIMRRYPQAITAFDRALAVDPRNYAGMIAKGYALLLDGKLAPARRSLAGLPDKVDPTGGASAARYELAWLSRRPRAALAALQGVSGWVQAPWTRGLMPVSLLRAPALALLDEPAAARAAYTSARAALRKALAAQPADASLWSYLGVAEAGLGESPDAVAAGRRATELAPIGRDSLDGPAYAGQLAAIYAALGERKPAVALLAQLLALPAGRSTSVELLRLDPTWDPLRGDPRFRALVGAGAPAAPATSGAVAGVPRRPAARFRHGR